MDETAEVGAMGRRRKEKDYEEVKEPVYDDGGDAGRGSSIGR